MGFIRCGLKICVCTWAWWFFVFDRIWKLFGFIESFLFGRGRLSRPLRTACPYFGEGQSPSSEGIGAKYHDILVELMEEVVVG